MPIFVKSWWPALSVAILVAAMALAVPRKAIFPEPKSRPPAKTAASFVVFNDAAERNLLAKARTTWRLGPDNSWAKSSPDWTEPIFLEGDAPSDCTIAQSAFFEAAPASEASSAGNAAWPALSAYAPPSLAAPDAPELSAAPGQDDPPGQASPSFTRAELLSLEQVE